MTFRNFRYIVILILVIINGALYAQKKETVTLSGKLTVKDTGKPPIGIITVAEKDVVDYWANEGNSPGTNRHTFVEKDGSYSFTINKGGTIVFNDGYNRYVPIIVSDINSTQRKDFVLDRSSKKGYSPNELMPHETKTDIHRRIKISGKMTYPDGKPMGNATIVQDNVFTAEAPGHSAHTTTLKDGTYEYRVLKGGRVSFIAPGYERQIFTATQDTVINVKMKKVNPFK